MRGSCLFIMVLGRVDDKGHFAPILYARIRGLQLSLLDILKTAGKVTHYCDIFNLVHRTLHKVV